MLSFLYSRIHPVQSEVYNFFKLSYFIYMIYVFLVKKSIRFLFKKTKFPVRKLNVVRDQWAKTWQFITRGVDGSIEWEHNFRGMKKVLLYGFTIVSKKDWINSDWVINSQKSNRTAILKCSDYNYPTPIIKFMRGCCES